MLLATTESAWYSNFSGFRRFSIVDRRLLDVIIEEQKLILSGLVESSLKIGSLTGATHVLEVSAYLHKDDTVTNGEYTDYINRLVDVETGTVTASVVSRSY